MCTARMAPNKASLPWVLAATSKHGGSQIEDHLLSLMRLQRQLSAGGKCAFVKLEAYAPGRPRASDRNEIMVAFFLLHLVLFHLPQKLTKRRKYFLVDTHSSETFLLRYRWKRLRLVKCSKHNFNINTGG